MLMTRVKLGKWECFSLLRKVLVCMLIQARKMAFKTLKNEVAWYWCRDLHVCDASFCILIAFSW